ncbi:unnamed protein product, partial [Laminaria digitata]
GNRTGSRRGTGSRIGSRSGSGSGSKSGIGIGNRTGCKIGSRSGSGSGSEGGSQGASRIGFDRPVAFLAGLAALLMYPGVGAAAPPSAVLEALHEGRGAQPMGAALSRYDFGNIGGGDGGVGGD